MKLVSTRGGDGVVDLRTAVFDGLAADGGLYLPKTLTRMSSEELSAIEGRPLQEIGAGVVRHLFGQSFPDDEIGAIVAETLDFPVPVVEISDGIHILELFHGPTGSFKDFGARFLARLVARFRKELEREVIVLVATSGDTGGAVAHAFHRDAGVRTVVLFPEGKVSRVQRRQLTEVGGNVEPVAVRGTFDDCQRLVKRGISDPALRETALLTSANSINVGRLLPQSFYYFHAWSRLGGPRPGPVFSVPCGNLGNLTGGVLARRMGLPVSAFVAATNVNDTIVRFLETGRLDPTGAVQTLSSAMDVAEPNNLERLIHLYGGDHEALRRDVVGSAHDDHGTLEAIRTVYEEHGYLMDPHTAVGWLALREETGRIGAVPGVVLATASPAKFPETVREATGVEPDWRSMLPPGAAGSASAPPVTEIDPRYEDLLPILHGVPA